MSQFFRKLSILVILTIVLTACSSQPGRETLYQVSSIASLLAGNYDGIETGGTLKARGDFGIGTFEAVDGEMVMLDGKIYQIKASGEVVQPPDSMKTPFSAVTYFDNDLVSDLGAVHTLDALKASLDKMIPRKDAFYALRVDGTFDTVKVRSVPRQEKPYPLLSEVTKKQSVFEYKNVKGTLVGFWCPDTVGGLNVPGYHLHFISGDRSQGGHLLEVSFSNAKAQVDETRNFEMVLAQGAGQAAGNMDTQSEIDKVEK